MPSFSHSFSLKNFNSHAHVERDGTHQKTIITEEDFNSHAHVERDDTMVVMLSISRISTHTLTWSVTRLSATLQKMYQYFNSHAHVERDLLCFTVSLVYVISTHTLTWSVTWRVVRRISTLSISTHTLTWSVTQKNICRTPIKSFQLTRSRGA